MAFKDFQDAREEISYHEFMQLPVAINSEMTDDWWDSDDRPVSFFVYSDRQHWISRHFGESRYEYRLHIEKEEMQSDNLEYLEMHLYLWLCDENCI